MPLYEYECEACGERFEVIRKFSDPPLEVCELCGRGPVSRLPSSPAIQFKGTGWYITDYAKKGEGGKEGGKGEGGKTGAESDKASGETRADTKSDAASAEKAGKADGTSTSGSASKTETPAKSDASSKPAAASKSPAGGSKD